MCGRYASFLPAEALAALFGTGNPLPNLAPSWNVAPTRTAPVVRRHPRTGARHLDLLSWGLVPHFTRDLKSATRPINARGETVATSGLFRSAFAARRCLVPADAFYEWQATPEGKRPHAVARVDGTPMAFAGLWESWRAPDTDEVLRTYVIITTVANATLRPLHARMPVIVEPADWDTWLAAGPDEGPDAAAGLLRPAGDRVVRVWRVGAAVGNVRVNTPDLLAPIDAAAPAPTGETQA